MESKQEISNFVRSKKIERMIIGARHRDFSGWKLYFSLPGKMDCWKARDVVTGQEYTVYDRDYGMSIYEEMRDITEATA